MRCNGGGGRKGKGGTVRRQKTKLALYMVCANLLSWLTERWAVEESKGKCDTVYRWDTRSTV